VRYLRHTSGTTITGLFGILGLLCFVSTGAAYAAEPTLPIEDVYDNVNGSVVVVRTLERGVVDHGETHLVPFSDQGSGVLISETGDVLTAAHLVQVADFVKVEFKDGTRVNATIVASDQIADLALLRLDEIPEKAVAVQLADSDAVRVGQQVFVIGAPYGLGHTLTVGHVSARHPPGTLSGIPGLAEFFQADVAIHGGNSGGPMFDMNGDVIGIVTHQLTQSGKFEGLGFSVTSNSVKKLLLRHRSLWSGVSVFALNEKFAGLLNLPQKSGLLVQRIAADSPGARIGLQHGFMPAVIGEQQLLLGGDIILDVDGRTVGTLDSYVELRRHLSEIEPGQTVRVRVLRKGRTVELTADFD
jgi:serine protease Do